MSQSVKVSADSVRQYLCEISRFPLLTAEDEIGYGGQVQTMMQLQRQSDTLAQRLGRSISELEWAEAVGLELGQLKMLLRVGDRAKRRLIESNLRLVVSIAKKYQNMNMEILDLLQEGGMALQQAVEKFDPTKGYRFSTYAYTWIRQAITRAISNQSRIIRLPVHVIERLTKIKKAQRELTGQLGRRATIAEVAAFLELKPEQVRDCLLRSQQPISLEIKTRDEHKTELSELLEDDAPTPEDYVVSLNLREHLAEWILELTPQQQEVIHLSYGLLNRPPMTAQEIADSLNLSRNQIRWAQQTAIKQLRQQQVTDENRLYLTSV